MKRNIIILVIIIAVALAFATTASASTLGDWFGKLKGVVTDQAIYIIAAGLMTIAGLFWKQASKYKNAAKEGIDVGLAIYKATRKNSPGGATITGDEVDLIFAQSGEFGRAIIAAAQAKAK